jgi:hypothetical protein
VDEGVGDDDGAVRVRGREERELGGQRVQLAALRERDMKAAVESTAGRE